MIKILHISPDFNYSCGVSKHVYIILKNLSVNSEYKLFFITNKGDSLERLDNFKGVDISLINFEKDHKNIFRMFNDLLKLNSFCKKNKIDIIHTHHRYPEFLAFLVSKLTNIKTITTVHSFVKGLKWISFRSHKIIAVSKAVNEYLNINYPHTKANSATLYNCVEEKYFMSDDSYHVEKKKSFGYELDDRILLFAGRINKIKGVDVLINSFKKVPKKLNIKLLLVGSIVDNSLKKLLTSQSPDIRHIESQSDIRTFYQIADVVVLPSREDPFPYVMLEAGAMCKPFIGSKVGGIAEFIDDNINGFLFESENIDELISKITYVFSNADVSKVASKNLFNKVNEISNCNIYCEKLNKFYLDLSDMKKT